MLEAGRPVVAQPNAGLPRRIEGRFAYMATPEYFDVFARRMLQAGATMIGWRPAAMTIASLPGGRAASVASAARRARSTMP